MTTLYATPDAAEQLRAWVPRFHARLSVPTEARTVPTRFGDTHLLLAGPADAPPVLLLHGAMASSSHMLLEAEGLASSFRLIVPDIVGHSPMSADARLPIDGYGAWATDVLDALELRRVAVVGVSYGGFVTLRLLAHAPDRVERASLVVPGGLVTAPIVSALIRAAWPLLLYRTWPSERRLRTFLDAQLTTWDDDWGHWLGDAVRLFRLDLRVPPLATKEELAAFRGPVQVFGADDDVHFPGPALIARARELLDVVDAELIADCRHAPPFTPAFRGWLAGRIASFLAT
ncbi:MAG: alpha/beta hydrolase [Myxococcales bacterium]|nr:alpha/beta hydrolase [Myxococcales bacterium]